MNKTNQHNEDQLLKEIAPTLFGMERKNNFLIPNGYFDHLADKIVLNTDEINKQNNFKVPDGYFEHFADRLEERIKQEEKVIPIQPKKRTGRLILITIAAAASIALIFIFNNPSEIKTNELAQVETQFEDLTTEQFEEALLDIKNESLISYLDVETDQTIEEDYEFENIDLDFSASEIDEYLSSDYYFDVEL